MLRAFQTCDELWFSVLHEILHPADYRLNWHSHEWTAFILTLSGWSTEIFPGFNFSARGILFWFVPLGCGMPINQSSGN